MAFSAPMQSTDNKNAQTIEFLNKNLLEYIYNFFMFIVVRTTTFP